MLVQGESVVKGTGPIRGDFLFGIEFINKLLCVLFGAIFDAKIVNAQGDCGGSCSVEREARIILGGFVYVWGKVSNKLVETDESCLFEAIHAALYLKVYKTIGGDVHVVAWIIPHFLGEHIWDDVDVLEVLHVNAKVEVFDDDTKVVGTFFGRWRMPK